MFPRSKQTVAATHVPATLIIFCLCRKHHVNTHIYLLIFINRVKYTNSLARKLAYPARYNGISAHIIILRVELSPLGFTAHYQLNPVFRPIEERKKASLKIQVAM